MHLVLSTDFRVFLFYWGSCGYRVDAKKNQINTSMKEALLCHSLSSKFISNGYLIKEWRRGYVVSRSIS